MLIDRVQALPGLRGVDSDLQLKTPQIEVKIDHNKAASLGLPPHKPANASNAYGSGQVSLIYTPNNQYTVILELQPQYQRDPSALSMLYVQADNGKLVPLSAIATISPTVGPLTVNHLAQLPSATVSFDTLPGVSLSDATTKIQQVAAQILPPR